MARGNRVVWLLGTGLLIAVSAGLSGCSAFYRNTVATEDYVLYSDNKQSEFAAASEFIGRSISAYRKVFPKGGADVLPPRIVYDQDDLSKQRIFVAETRQEGYYLPLLRLIHLAPRNYHGDGRDTHKLILHELAHHFLISIYPISAEASWLNEGLACCLEMGYFDEHGELRQPLYHPWLHLESQEALQKLGKRRLAAEMATLLDRGWSHFRKSPHKARSYALSWAFTYYLLEQHAGSVQVKVESLLDLSPAQLHARIPSFVQWLQRSTDQALERVARDPNHRDWALDVWVDLPAVDGRNLLPVLREDLGAPAGPRRTAALRALSAALHQPLLRGLGRQERHKLLAELTSVLANGSSPECVAVADELRRRGRYNQPFLRPLVALLEHQDGEVRASAAGALARLTAKPTVTNPRFWRSASEAERRSEISEWQSWLTSRRY